MQRLSAHAQELASAAASTRSIGLSRRAQLRDAFTVAVQERTAAVSSATNSIISATATATAELWSTGGEAMEEARNSLTCTVERVGGMVTEAEEILAREERSRCALEPTINIAFTICGRHFLATTGSGRAANAGDRAVISNSPR